MQIKHVWLAGSLLVALGMGCSRTESTTATEPNSGTGATGMASTPGGDERTGPKYDASSPASPAGAPDTALGVPMGNGFRSLTADQAGGMGTGLQGFNDVGAAGTSGAITDTHHAERGDESNAGVTSSTGPHM